jgi:hypothetical protein
MNVNLDHIGVGRIEYPIAKLDPAVRFHARTIHAGTIDTQMQGWRVPCHDQKPVEKQALSQAGPVGHQDRKADCVPATPRNRICGKTGIGCAMSRPRTCQERLQVLLSRQHWNPEGPCAHAEHEANPFDRMAPSITTLVGLRNGL